MYTPPAIYEVHIVLSESSSIGVALSGAAGRMGMRVINISLKKSPPTPSRTDQVITLMSTHEEVMFAVVAIVTCIVAYAPMMTYKGFVMDDAVAVQRNPNVVSDFVSLSDFFRRDFWGLELFAGTWTHKSFRPVTTWTYRLGFLLHGIDSVGFHVMTLLLHIVCSAYIGMVGRTVVGLNRTWSAVAVALFAAHPIHSENLLYLVGRADVLATIFFAAALIVGEREMTKHNLGLMTLLTTLSGLSKETGFTAPLIGAAIDIVKTRRFGSTKSNLHVIVGVALMVWRHRYTNGTEVNMSVQDNPFSYETNLTHRVLSFAFVHAKYFQLLLFPAELSYDYSLTAIAVLRQVSDVRLLLVVAAYSAMAGIIHFAVHQYMKRTVLGLQLLIGLTLLVVPWLPASNILFPVGTVIGERLLYTPSVGFVLLIASIGQACKKWRMWTIRIVILIVGIYIVRTAYRVTDWADGDTLFIRDGHRQPASSKTQFNLGITHMSSKEYDKAVAALIRCAAADPMSALPYWRIGQIAILRGDFVTAEAWLMEASTKFSATLMIKDEEIFHDIAVAVFQNKKWERSHFYLSLALEINQKFPKGLNNYGCLIAAREPKRSVEFLKRAVELKPDSVLYLNNLAFMAEYAGDAAAVDFVQKVRPGLTVTKRDCVWEFVPAS